MGEKMIKCGLGSAITGRILTKLANRDGQGFKRQLERCLGEYLTEFVEEQRPQQQANPPTDDEELQIEQIDKIPQTHP